MVFILAGSCLVAISASLLLVVAVAAARKCLRRMQQQHSPHRLGTPSGQPPWLEAIRAYRAVRAPRPGSAATQTFPGSQYGIRGRPTSGSARAPPLLLLLDSAQHGYCSMQHAAICLRADT